MTTVCVDPDDFQTDSSGRLQIKTACGTKNTADGIAFDGHANDFVCVGTTEQIRVKPNCGIVRTTTGLSANVSNCEVYAEKVNAEDDITRGPGLTYSVIAIVQIDATNWCHDGAASFNVGGLIDIETSGGATYQLKVQHRLGADPTFTDLHPQVKETFSAYDKRERFEWFGPETFYVPAGSIFNARFALFVTNTGAAGNILIRQMQTEARGMVVSRAS